MQTVLSEVWGFVFSCILGTCMGVLLTIPFALILLFVQVVMYG